MLITSMDTTSSAFSGCTFLMAFVGVSALPLVACATGTALLSSAANACNQLVEAPYDAQMKRTQNRVLVIHRFSPLHALSFAAITATSGVVALCMFANPLGAALGALNLVIYAGIYTPLKRTHIACTWAGAVVGAIPPLMGYVALDAPAFCLQGKLPNLAQPFGKGHNILNQLQTLIPNVLFLAAEHQY